MGDLKVQAELIVAIFDLKVVQGIRNAVRVNTLRMGGREGPLGNIENPKPPPSLPNYGEQHHPGGAVGAPQTQDATIERRVVESTCHCDCDRPARHATFANPERLPNLIPTDVTLPATDAERASGLPSQHPSPLVPPWALPLPLVSACAVKVIKYPPPHVDVIHKGVYIDIMM